MHNVVGYSNGDGNVYHMDGKVFQKGEVLASASEIYPDGWFDRPKIFSPDCRW